MTGKLLPMAAAFLALPVHVALAADEAEPPAPATAEVAPAAEVTGGDDAATEKTYTYTWDQLVELIPDLKDATIEEPRRARSGVPGEAQVAQELRVCLEEHRIGSRIPRRACYTLDELIERRLRSQDLYQQIVRGQMTFGHIDP